MNAVLTHSPFAESLSSEPGLEPLEDVIKKYEQVVQTMAQHFFKQYKKFLAYEDVDDLVQNGFMRFPSILKNYQKYSHEVGFEQFLRASLKKVFLDVVKRHVRRAQFPSEFLQHKIYENPDFRFDDELHEQKEKVRSALKNLEILDPNMADVALDYYFEDMSDPQIAEQRKLTRNQVWRVRQKSLQRLHEIMIPLKL